MASSIRSICRKTKYDGVYDYGTSYGFSHNGKVIKDKSLRFILNLRDNLVNTKPEKTLKAYEWRV